MREEIRKYVEEEIVPRYGNFDAAHRVDHVSTVIQQSLELAKYYDVDEEMVYVIAAFHDTGLVEGREFHHLASGKIIRSTEKLKKWFDAEQIETMAQAAEDHRASSDHEPRTIYGKIVAEADRIIDGETIIRRTVQYGLSHYPELSKEQHWQRMLDHIAEKYDTGGYLKLWIPESPNAQRLAAFREMIKDKERLRVKFEEAFDTLTEKNL